MRQRLMDDAEARLILFLAGLSVGFALGLLAAIATGA